MCACPGIMLITEYVFPYLHHAGGFALSLVDTGAQKMFLVLQKKKKIIPFGFNGINIVCYWLNIKDGVAVQLENKTTSNPNGLTSSPQNQRLPSLL